MSSLTIFIIAKSNKNDFSAIPFGYTDFMITIAVTNCYENCLHINIYPEDCEIFIKIFHCLIHHKFYIQLKFF